MMTEDKDRPPAAVDIILKTNARHWGHRTKQFTELAVYNRE